MGRPKKPDSEKLINVGLYVSPQHEAELKQIVDDEGIDRGYITRAFYLRGLAAFRRDGQLKEPADAVDAYLAQVMHEARKLAASAKGVVKKFPAASVGSKKAAKKTA
jgi:hypothetical protein